MAETFLGSCELRIHLRALQIQVKKGIGSSVFVLNREARESVKCWTVPPRGGGGRLGEIESVFNLRLMTNAPNWG